LGATAQSLDPAIVTRAKALVRTPAAVLGADDLRRFRLGEAVFNTPFESDPAAPRQRAGLGPRFNAPACDACHNSGGRGGPPAEGESPFQSVVHAAVRAPASAAATSQPLRVSAVEGIEPDIRATVGWIEEPWRYADRTPYSLRRPVVLTKSVRAGLGDLTGATLRVPNALLGLGLLDAVSDTEIARGADPADRNGDGIRGRVHWVRDAEGRRRVGRFGWKATQPTLHAQTTFALAHEMGLISRWDRPPEAAATEPVEIPDELVLALVAFQRDGSSPAVTNGARGSRGEALFRGFGCASCHREEMRTARVPGKPWLSNQLIRPYTDLLLHDLGPDLAAAAVDGDAQPQEWRTAPLWGLSLVGALSRHRVYLHDGRARSVEEAILWHGGEAEVARTRFRAAAAEDRAALLAFLATL
jgi:CxxC motif-containing protein (DUF1111 family)